MRLLPSIAAIFFCAGLSAQHWDTLPGVRPTHIAHFYDDASAGNLIGYGSFDSAGVSRLPAIAAWNGSAWTPAETGMPPLSAGSSIGSVLRYNGNLLMAGFIHSWNVGRPYIAEWNGTALDSFARLNGGWPGGMLTHQGDLIVYGTLDTIENVQVNNIAKWDGANWSDIGFGNFVGSVDKAISYRGDLYAVGIASSDNLEHVFRLVNNTWQIVGQDFSSGLILDMCIYNNELYVGGYFSMNGNSPSGPGNAIAKLDTLNNTWTNVGGGLRSVSVATFVEVYAMTVHNGALYTMGWFDRAGGANAPYLAKWDGTQWCGFGIGFSWTLFAMADYNDTLYLSTDLIFDNDTTKGFVKWYGDNFTDTCGVITTGIAEIAYAPDVSVYPNPATSTAIFTVHGATQMFELIMYDNLGQEVWRGKSERESLELSTEGFEPGMYLYRIMENGKPTAAGKLIVE